MAMKGIDISSHQGDIDLSALSGVEFVIIKATEGTTYVNPYCDVKYTQAKGLRLHRGFYHFAGEGDALAEADYFIANCEGYFGDGIPVLDWEGNQDVAWVNRFVGRVHGIKGVWPWIYANPWRFNQGGVNPNCARWVADYPPVNRPSISYDPGQPPAADGLVACWQFASDGAVPGYAGNLDVSEFYGDASAWRAYTGGRAVIEEKPAPAGETVLENDRYVVTIREK